MQENEDNKCDKSVPIAEFELKRVFLFYGRIKMENGILFLYVGGLLEILNFYYLDLWLYFVRFVKTKDMGYLLPTWSNLLYFSYLS